MNHARPSERAVDGAQPPAAGTLACSPTTTGRSFAVALRQGSDRAVRRRDWNIETGREHPVEDADRGTCPLVADCVGRSRVSHDGRECRGHRAHGRHRLVGWHRRVGRRQRRPWSWQLHAYDLATGQQVWKQEVATGQPLRRRHLKATHANCTPVDQRRVRGGVLRRGRPVLFRLSGNLVWKTGFGRLHAGTVTVQRLRMGIRQLADHS